MYSYVHLESSQLICFENQMAGFYMTCKNIENMKLQCNISLKNVKNLVGAIISQNKISIVVFNVKKYLF